MSKPTVLILTAGASSRFFPFNEFHKSYNRVTGKALISHTIQNLLDNDFSDLVVVVGQNDIEGVQLRKILTEDGIQANLKIVTQPHPTGATGAILAAREHITGPFVITSPYYTRAGVWADEMWSIYQETNAQGVLLASEVENPSLYGILKFEGSKVLEIVEKPAKEQAPSNLRARSIYLFHQDLLHYLDKQPDSEYSFEAGYSQLARENFVTFKNTTDVNITLKYPWHLLDLKDVLLHQRETSIDKEAIVAETTILDDSAGPIIIEAGATVKDFVKIIGPTFIGKNALIGEYSFIRQSSVEAHATVGANTEVVRSLISPHATLHSCFIADSILGEHAHIGAGLITANKRFDRATISTTVKEDRVDSYRHNLGVIVGPKANIGIGVKSMPGTIIGPQQVVEPGIVIKGTVR